MPLFGKFYAVHTSISKIVYCTTSMHTIRTGMIRVESTMAKLIDCTMHSVSL